MPLFLKPRGWHIHHQEQLLLRANAGNPMLRLKFFHYPNYRQIVRIEMPPAKCKLKSKGNNAFFLFQQKVHEREIISLERLINVYPTISVVDPKDEWGSISEIPEALQQKYKESSRYWPVSWATDGVISKEEWFETDDLSRWVQEAHRFIRGRIKHPERQEKRWGAQDAYLTGIGDCDEFTDLFITLARMRGIPCRRLTGYFIYWKNVNVNVETEAHAWVEILSPKAGWTVIDVALNNIGAHSINYVILKIEEFNPALPDYQIRAKHLTMVHYKWERPKPIITPLY